MTDYERSSGNVFADLGLKHPKRELRRAKRILEICRRLEELEGRAMTELIYMRCDGCGIEVKQEFLPPHWARVSVDLKNFHYCPSCWEEVHAHLPWRKPT